MGIYCARKFYLYKHGNTVTSHDISHVKIVYRFSRHSNQIKVNTTKFIYFIYTFSCFFLFDDCGIIFSYVSAMVTDRHEVSILLDKLTIEMLRLMEDKIKCEIEIENITGSGNINLAKSRYISGQQSVSAVQLPTENSPDFDALATVERNENQYSIIMKKPNSSNELVNPIKWFGVLTSQNLHRAQEIFKNAITYIVRCVNIQNKLNNVCDNITYLRRVKAKLTPEE